jgi:hypothetical protein
VLKKSGLWLLRRITETDAGKALQHKKIKNKVLKLQIDMLKLQIEVAQGNTGKSELTTQQAFVVALAALSLLSIELFSQLVFPGNSLVYANW